MSARGYVVDADGRPVAGIRVFAVMGYEYHRREYGSLKAPTTTDESGTVVFESLRKPEYGYGWYLIAFEPDR